MKVTAYLQRPICSIVLFQTTPLAYHNKHKLVSDAMTMVLSQFRIQF